MADPASGAVMTAEAVAAPEPSGRRRRRPPWRVLAGGALGVSMIGGAVLLTSTQSPLAVAEVSVQGAGPTIRPAVDAMLPDAVGQPFRAVDGAALADRLQRIEGVRDASVSWTWWNTLTIEVQEQAPVAVIEVPDGFQMIDAQAEPVRTVAEAPLGLPLLQADKTADRLAGLQVIDAIPGGLLPQTAAVRAAEGRVEVLMTSGAVADLGRPERLSEKFDILKQLLPLGADGYSVAVPERPALQGVPVEP